MREKVEKILGYPIPPDLDFILQRGIIAGKTAEEIADLIRKAQ